MYSCTCPTRLHYHDSIVYSTRKGRHVMSYRFSIPVKDKTVQSNLWQEHGKFGWFDHILLIGRGGQLGKQDPRWVGEIWLICDTFENHHRTRQRRKSARVTILALSRRNKFHMNYESWEKEDTNFECQINKEVRTGIVQHLRRKR